MNTGTLAIILSLSIPIIAILAGLYKDYLAFKSEHKTLDSSTTELESQLKTMQETLERLESERDGLQRRVQNLETIVTSDAWDAIAEDGPLNPPGRLDLPPEPDRTNDGPASDEEDRAADLARRLRNQ